MKQEFIDAFCETKPAETKQCSSKKCLNCQKEIIPSDESSVASCTFCMECGLHVFSINPIKNADGNWTYPWVYCDDKPKYKDKEWIKNNARGANGNLLRRTG